MEPVPVCADCFAIMRLEHTVEENVDRGSATAPALRLCHRLSSVEVLASEGEGGCGDEHAAGDDQQGHGGQEGHGLRLG